MTYLYLLVASLMAQMVKNLPAMRETWIQSLGWKIPWRRAWQPTPVFLPEKFHGEMEFWWAMVHGEGIGYPPQYSWASAVAQLKLPQCRRPGFNPWVGRSPGGGDGNPLQYSCPENLHGQRSLAGHSPWRVGHD